MRRYLLDTGILVHYARGSALYKQIEQDKKLTEPNCVIEEVIMKQHNR